MHNVPLFDSPRSFYEGPLVLLNVCHFLMHKSHPFDGHSMMVNVHFMKVLATHEYVRAPTTYPRSLC